MRYTRQELKHDKFTESAAEAIHWTAAHRQKLINVGIAAVVIIVLLAGGFWYVSYRNDKAGVELGKALAIYNAPVRPEGIPDDPSVKSYANEKDRATAAKAEFAKVADQYGSTQSGQMAKYFMALCDQELGNLPASEQELKAQASGRNSDVAGLAKFALASIYRESNRESEAVNTYKDLIEHPTTTVPKTTAQLELAEVYEAKQPAEAKKLYQQIAKDDPKGPAAQIATERDANLK